MKRGSAEESGDGGIVNDSVAFKYGFSIVSGDEGEFSRRGIERYKIPAWQNNEVGSEL